MKGRMGETIGSDDRPGVVGGPWTERDGLLRSPLLEGLGLVAGFSTRRLGSMAGAGTPIAEQARNREKLAAMLGFDAVVRVRQVHGDRVVYVEAPFAPLPSVAGAPLASLAGAPTPGPDADAMWTDRRGVLLGVAAADCVPVLLAEPGGRIGAAHAGWEGTSRGIAGRLARALADAGARPDRMVASLAPSIGPCCYTISEERAAIVRERLGPATDIALRDRDGQIVMDLWAANAAQLWDEGVRTIEISGLCTRCGGEDVWSYRGRDRVGLGTGLAVIGRPA